MTFAEGFTDVPQQDIEGLGQVFDLLIGGSETTLPQKLTEIERLCAGTLTEAMIQKFRLLIADKSSVVDKVRSRLTEVHQVKLDEGMEEVKSITPSEDGSCLIIKVKKLSYNGVYYENLELLGVEVPAVILTSHSTEKTRRHELGHHYIELALASAKLAVENDVYLSALTQYWRIIDLANTKGEFSDDDVKDVCAYALEALAEEMMVDALGLSSPRFFRHNLSTNKGQLVDSVLLHSHLVPFVLSSDAVWCCCKSLTT